MKKAIIKWVAIGLLMLLVLTSFGYNVFGFIKNYNIEIINQSSVNTVYQIVQTIQKNKEITLPIFGQDGKQTGSITLIEKPHDAKK